MQSLDTLYGTNKISCNLIMNLCTGVEKLFVLKLEIPEKKQRIIKIVLVV